MPCAILRPEAAEDTAAIHVLHRAAFGQEVEARLVDALREGGFSRVSLVALADSTESVEDPTRVPIMGHVLFTELRIIHGDQEQPALALAPLAVLPEYQRNGIGTALVQAGLAACRRAGHSAVFVVGDPRYYGRFGFSTEMAAPFECVYACEAFMALELQPGTLSKAGRVEYPAAFADL